ncbi:MAG: 4'-phosphopantetheinyl transferase superfamily protein [Verrucomicrobiota bacterium]|nr:4'-phosphopantetheinyl transferase superfamily protein [Verrucomicrobiota bacterium]
MRDRLNENQALILFADTRKTSAATAALLSQELLTEEEKARRFIRTEDLRDYIAARSLLRLGLSSCFEVEPAKWNFGRDERGKPFVISPTNLPPFQFSLSHTRGLVALLVSFAPEAGIDVEQMKRTNDLKLVAQRVCSRGELEPLDQLTGEKWQQRFFQLWTLKEAYAKARGLGLGLPLQSISFDIESQDKVIAADRSDWQFHLARVAPNHMLATALRRERSDAPYEFELREFCLTSR